LGPSPTLTGMATCTLKAKYEAEDDSISRTLTILCHTKNVKEIYYQLEAMPSNSEAGDVPAPTPAAAAPVAAVPPVVAAVPSWPATTIEEVPLKAIDILSVIVAQKSKKRVDEVPLSKSIKDLVGGKLTLQNEIWVTFSSRLPWCPRRVRNFYSRGAMV
ncbi:hypothetical protein B0H11DRAFT_1733661, partial [Mycena galericulata]